MSTLRERFIGPRYGFLTLQADELREMAVKLGVNGVCTGDLSKLYVMLCEAADTITSLSDKLQGVMGTRYNELFGSPERTANVILALQICPCAKDECVFCPAHDVCFEHYKGGRTVYEMAEWLMGNA